MLKTCTDGLLGIRDRALLCFAFASGGRRRSEVAKADMAQLVKLDADTYVFRLAHSKNQQTGAAQNPDADKPITGPAARALAAWLETAGIQSGPIFRRIRGRIVTEQALSGQAVWLIVKRRAPLGVTVHFVQKVPFLNSNEFSSLHAYFAETRAKSTRYGL
jgi:integrase